MTPEKFINQTNGVTPRRWVQQANPGLAEFLQQQLGEGWPTDLPCFPAWKIWPASQP
jgi:starch phosphorylase